MKLLVQPRQVHQVGYHLLLIDVDVVQLERNLHFLVVVLNHSLVFLVVVPALGLEMAQTFGILVLKSEERTLCVWLGSTEVLSYGTMRSLLLWYDGNSLGRSLR